MIMAYACIFAVLLFLYTLHTHIPTSFSETTPNVISKNTKLSIRLIHHHSICPLSTNDDARAPLMAAEYGSVFLVNVSMGDPPVPQLLVMDTGSDITWVRCSLCEMCDFNVFDPNKSSTYSELSISSPRCPNRNHGTRRRCPFTIRYGDGFSLVKGFLALEKFTFITSTEGAIEVPNVVFGCPETVSGHASDFNGILGLAARVSMPLFTEGMGRNFSYCIGNIEDERYMYNQLILGDGAIIQGDTTPVWRDRGGHYVVFLEGISVGGKEQIMDHHEFHQGIMIDTGSTYTWLCKSAYDVLAAEVKELMAGIQLEPSKHTYDGNPFCYRGNLTRDLEGFPTVTLRFQDGAEIELDIEGLFKRTYYGSDYCLAIVESKRPCRNILGIVAQQYYNVGFDLDANTVSFQRIECELLED